MTRRRVKQKPLPEGWVVTEHLVANGRHVEKGTELTVRGIRGRVKFIKHVRTPKAEWLEVLDRDQHFRSIYPDRVKTVHWKKKLRASKVA